MLYCMHPADSFAKSRLKHDVYCNSHHLQSDHMWSPKLHLVIEWGSNIPVCQLVHDLVAVMLRVEQAHIDLEHVSVCPTDHRLCKIE